MTPGMAPRSSRRWVDVSPLLSRASQGATLPTLPGVLAACPLPGARVPCEGGLLPRIVLLQSPGLRPEACDPRLESV